MNNCLVCMLAEEEGVYVYGFESECSIRYQGELTTHAPAGAKEMEVGLRRIKKTCLPLMPPPQPLAVSGRLSGGV